MSGFAWIAGPGPMGWLLLAAAAVLVPVGVAPMAVGSFANGRPHAETASASESDASPAPVAGSRSAGWLSSKHASAVAAAAAALACVVALGLVHGVVAAAVVGPAVLAGVRALARRPPSSAVDRSVALPLDLAAAALRGGRPLADALALSAPACATPSREVLLRVAGLLRLGAAPEHAWALVPAGHPLAPLAAAALRSASSGIRLADAFERHAGEIRDEATAACITRAQRAGITAMAPLAACFLPSFVCLGVVPVVLGIATRAFGVLR